VLNNDTMECCVSPLRACDSVPFSCTTNPISTEWVRPKAVQCPHRLTSFS
jgi:hypothetical protein